MTPTRSLFIFTYEDTDCVMHFRTGEITQPCCAVMAASLEEAVNKLTDADPFGIDDADRYKDYIENGGIDYNITDKVHE